MKRCYRRHVRGTVLQHVCRSMFANYIEPYGGSILAYLQKTGIIRLPNFNSLYVCTENTSNMAVRFFTQFSGVIAPNNYTQYDVLSKYCRSVMPACQCAAGLLASAVCQPIEDNPTFNDFLKVVTVVNITVNHVCLTNVEGLSSEITFLYFSHVDSSATLSMLKQTSEMCSKPHTELPIYGI